MDALTHCIEAYLAKDYHPICDGIALEGLRLGAPGPPKCVETPKDVRARADMMMSSMMGAIAFQKGLGLVHSLAHALSTLADLHHGYANGLMIDHGLPFNVPTSADRFKVMAQVVGLKHDSPQAFMDWVRDLKARVGIPATLAEAGVPRQIDKLSDLALQDTCHLNNPRPCTRTTSGGSTRRPSAHERHEPRHRDGRGRGARGHARHHRRAGVRGRARGATGMGAGPSRRAHRQPAAVPRRPPRLQGGPGAQVDLRVGKPIRQSWAELDAMPARIDFFLDNVGRVMEGETVHADAAKGLKSAWPTSRSASWPTSRPGTIPTSWGPTSSCLRS
jgi:hypothetical protein